MSIVTRTGDDGTTRTPTGKKVRKDHPVVEFIGQLDELISFLGLAKHKVDVSLKGDVQALQRKLFGITQCLCAPENGCAPVNDDLKWVEERIKHYESFLEMDGFFIPGGTEGSALLDVCRSVARRAERAMSRVHRDVQENEIVMKFMNRLSDLLFLMARYQEKICDKLEKL